MESNEHKLIEKVEPDVEEDPKHYLHQFSSPFFMPLYEIFICYGHEDYNDKNEDEGSINTSVNFEKVSRETENAYSQRDKGLGEYESWHGTPHLELINLLDSQLA